MPRSALVLHVATQSYVANIHGRTTHVKDSILFDQKGAELGSVQTLNLGDAEVFERTDDTIIARWREHQPGGANLQDLRGAGD
jgi:hypothetical protein